MRSSRWIAARAAATSGWSATGPIGKVSTSSAPLYSHRRGGAAAIGTVAHEVRPRRAQDEGCIFCLAAQPGEDGHRHVLRRGKRSLVMLNAFPYNSGHVMVSPHRHVPSIEDLDAAELLELMTLAQRALRALRDAYQPHGFNLGINQGEVAGAGFAGHVHLHVVPRWAADSNFMAVTGDTRVLPQSLEDSYATLRPRLV
jgi:ATP adenylyltransferase